MVFVLIHFGDRFDLYLFENDFEMKMLSEHLASRAVASTRDCMFVDFKSVFVLLKHDIYCNLSY